jgi:hypothetical protein
MKEQKADRMDKWLLRARIWCPISPPQPSPIPEGAEINSFAITPGHEDEEIGKIRFVPLQGPQIKGNPKMDTPTQRCSIYDVEVTIEAPDIQSAIYESREYLNSKLDLLTFLTMHPCEVTNYLNIVNLSQQRLYDQGNDVECETASFGEAYLPQSKFPPLELLFPHSSSAINRALRWFRKGLLSVPGEDRFLCYYTALEAISDIIKEQKESQHICKSCGKNTGIPKSHTDGIKFVLTDILNKPQNMFGKISGVRAKIVHGASGKKLKAEVDRFLPLLEDTLISALKHALGLRQEGLPRSGMTLVDPVAEAILVIKYRGPQREAS